MALINCPECGQEISDKAQKCIHCGKEFTYEKPYVCKECGKEIPADATECSFCGCPVKQKSLVENDMDLLKYKKTIKNKKILIPIVIVVIIAILSFLVYNFTVVKPKKTYSEAINLLENGKYEDGKALLETIPNYEDVNIILEQVTYESYAYSCVNILKQYLKNPDSFSPYEVEFYESSDDEEESDKYPICIIHYGAQNGFGGNTTSYAYFDCFNDSDVYELVGTCDSLDQDDYDTNDQDDFVGLITCAAINMYREDYLRIGNIDMQRFKTVIKNDAYSTIKIIE